VHFFKTAKFKLKQSTIKLWRTLANQEVILRIGPLGKLGHFELTAEIFLVYIASISLASGLSITSWYAKALRDQVVQENFIIF
jgi:hypothetical protein